MPSEKTQENPLRTLKELEIEVIDQVGNQPVIHKKLIDSYDLRQEAIKWIKKLQSAKDSYCLLCGESFGVCHDFEETGNKPCEKASYGTTCLANYDYESSDITGAIVFLKHFFNITEDDLK